ncbi:zinc finger protein ZAT12-like [Impatiens glandulifera]|uniref:zinc finger protein ZAT12-like n=1 Tax=Impatiens glandulifera TaxID=253017 RepID=UPI001FB0DF01|nr:zinc finger protein ZAT12-like [Impatiens glandulifera]
MVHHVGMKRQRDQMADPNLTNIANCLMIMARGGGDFINPNYIHHQDVVTHEQAAGTRVFECKTCNRQFLSFQALGGHRASHKKPRHTGDLSLQPSLSLMISSQQPATKPKPKPKTHECSICGLEFAIGQALGGHMRRHRAATLAENQPADLSLSPPPPLETPPPVFVPHVLKRSNSCKRICLDLNLTPKENGMDNFHQFMNIRDQKVSPILHCYF